MNNIKIGSMFGDDIFVSGQVRELKNKKIKREICDFYQYEVGKYGDDTVQIANYVNDFGEKIGQHIIGVNGSIEFIGNQYTCQLFGQHLFQSGGNRVYITANEIDAMTIYQSLRIKQPVVSLNGNIEDAKTELKRNYKFLDSFKEVVFAFTNTPESKKVIEESKDLFNKIKIVQYPTSFLTINDLITNNNESELFDSITKPKDYTPSCILDVSSSDADDFVTDDSTNYGFNIPFTKLNHKIEGVRKGEILTVTSGSGMGKSTMVTEIAKHLMTEHNQKIGVFSLEKSEKKAIREMVGLELNIPERRLGEIPPEVRLDAKRRIFKDSNFYLYLHKEAGLGIDAIMPQMRYMAKGLDVDFIVFDHISIAVTGQQNEREALDQTMNMLREFVEQTGVGIILVVHTKRNQGKGFENGAELSLSDIRGSGGIGQVSDIVIGLERNQQSENDEGNITQIRILKNRYTGITGKAGEAMYVQETGRFISWEEEDLPDNPMSDPRQGLITEVDRGECPF